MLLGLLCPAAAAQPRADTLFTWRGYSNTSITRVQLYPAPPDAETRVHTVVLKELARNEGPTIVSDLRFLADRVGRQFGIDPARAYWILHWGAFSFPEAAATDKHLLIRATFRRTDSGRLSAPYWRVITDAEARELTDRRFRP